MYMRTSGAVKTHIQREAEGGYFFSFCGLRFKDWFTLIRYTRKHGTEVICKTCERAANKKRDLYRKVTRLQAKAEKQGYQWNDIQLAIFAAMGRSDWDEAKINWLVLDQFEKLYVRFYPLKKGG